MDAKGEFDAYVQYFPKQIPRDAIKRFTEVANTKFPAQRSKCKVFGHVYDVPRDQFVVFFDGTMPIDYTYSGHSVPIVAEFPELLQIRHEVEAKTLTKYNFVLINRYKDGKDGVGWHADDEPTINQSFPIASVSIGGSRHFDLRMTRDKTRKMRLTLSDGDLAVMLSGCQEACQHQVPKQAKTLPRINLTFRVLSAKPSHKRKHDES